MNGNTGDATGLHADALLDMLDIHQRGFQPLREVMQSFVANGGQIWACGSCATPRGITEANLIEGARIVTAAAVVERLGSSAASLSF